mmetsp:Transcript_8375/g.11710  ORF Transcript_8375/g.11710 Transcript_8375/m.11710 type:complete len:351 (+) Transcript_8375:150-1202(+)|eukprot:CAMPEP_0170072650 /NCGR_PEP_ID=MMETSP0019_2-20121128/10253_1 /TAXON_ID=98059 /ORGANISM="Dinobryon sp., Strain UTEXLB2267" /LENGTH=350 /DNA_ID=CAMNT_0010281763 /DNA_START=87 /DNA_END=1139 /DNA_ORIENTATION=-
MGDDFSPCDNCHCYIWQHDFIGITVFGETHFFHSFVPQDSKSTSNIVRKITPPGGKTLSSAASSTEVTNYQQQRSGGKFGTASREKDSQFNLNTMLNKQETRSIFSGYSSKDTEGNIRHRQLPTTTGSVLRKRGAGAVTSSSGGVLVSKLPEQSTPLVTQRKQQQLPILLLFFLRQDKKAPVLSEERLQLQRRKQFYDNFTYSDGVRSITRDEFEEYFADIDDIHLRELFRTKDYTFYRQIGAKRPTKTGYNSNTFPDLDEWRSMAQDSKKFPLICSPYEDDMLDRSKWGTFAAEDEYRPPGEVPIDLRSDDEDSQVEKQQQHEEIVKKEEEVEETNEDSSATTQRKKRG